MNSSNSIQRPGGFTLRQIQPDGTSVIQPTRDEQLQKLRDQATGRLVSGWMAPPKKHQPDDQVKASTLKQLESRHPQIDQTKPTTAPAPISGGSTPTADPVDPAALARWLKASADEDLFG